MTSAELQKACLSIFARGTKPTLSEVRPLVDAFYKLPNNGAGGSLHIVLDDGNWHRSHIEFCQEYAAKNGDETGRLLAGVLLLLSPSQQRRL